MSISLFVSMNPLLQVVQRSLPGKQVGGVPASEARLDVEHGHVPPIGRVAVGAGVRTGRTGFVLDELEEGLHVGPHAGQDPCPHHCHRLLVTGLQNLQQGAVVPAGSAQDTQEDEGGVYNTALSF